MNFDQNYGVVLCKWQRGPADERRIEYVTWQVRVSDQEVNYDTERDTFIPYLVAEVGHYFTSNEKAMEDYYNRIVRGY
jgi:hypothetical protein